MVMETVIVPVDLPIGSVTGQEEIQNMIVDPYIKMLLERLSLDVRNLQERCSPQKLVRHQQNPEGSRE